MRVLHFNKDEVYLGRLHGIIEMEHHEEINGENFVELTTISPIDKNDRLVYRDQDEKWHEFIVRNVDESREGEVLIRDAFAEHSISETIGDYIVDSYIQDKNITTALTSALAPTRWSVGTVDVEGNNTAHFYNTNSRTAIQDILEIWGGEVRYRIVVTDHRVTGRFVDIVNQRGQVLNRRFTYNKNLESIKKTVNDNDVITALYGFGKGDKVVEGTKVYTKRLDFASINGGKAYVENNTAKNNWGRVNGSSKVHVFSKIEMDDVEDKAELLELTQKKLSEISQPNITYEASIFDLARLDNRYDPVGLGDSIYIIDREFTPELRLSARAIKLVQNLVTKDATSVTLGNFSPTLANVLGNQGQQINELRNRSSGGGTPVLDDYIPRVDKFGEFREYTNPIGYFTGQSRITGAIVIELGPENVMLDGQITLRSYTDLANLTFGGYTYMNTSSWHLPEVMGDSIRPINVRFATNTVTNRRVIILGEHTTRWDYLHVAIPRASNGYGGFINTGVWKISMEADLTKYTVSKTVSVG